MSDPGEGVVPQSRDSVARQSLKQLRTRLWALGAKLGRLSEHERREWDNPPELIRFQVMDKLEFWRRAEDGSRGEATLYELQRGWTDG